MRSSHLWSVCKQLFCREILLQTTSESSEANILLTSASDSAMATAYTHRHSLLNSLSTQLVPHAQHASMHAIQMLCVRVARGISVFFTKRGITGFIICALCNLIG